MQASISARTTAGLSRATRPHAVAPRRHPRALVMRKSDNKGSASVVDIPAAAPAISLSEAALKQLHKLRADKGEAAAELLLRVGVKQGGCSGMSYVMDFETKDKVKEDDMVMSYEKELGPDGFQLVVDPKSLLYLFGMRLDFSDALIGGGFQFMNPNATDSCGCGKSFNV